jgi:hypothetical protein
MFERAKTVPALNHSAIVIGNSMFYDGDFTHRRRRWLNMARTDTITREQLQNTNMHWREMLGVLARWNRLSWLNIAVMMSGESSVPTATHL